MTGFAQDHGRVMSQWSTFSARPTKADAETAALTEPVFRPAKKFCDAGIHVVANYGDPCEMCRVIGIGARAAAMRRVVV